MRRGSRIVPRSTSGTPKRRQYTPSIASAAATRRSHHNASSIPPATAGPSIAAITGFPSRRRVGPIGPGPSSVTDTGRRSAPAIAFRSAPAQKYPPAPVSTATWADSSASNASNAASSAAAVTRVDRVAALGTIDRDDPHRPVVDDVDRALTVRAHEPEATATASVAVRRRRCRRRATCSAASSACSSVRAWTIASGRSAPTSAPISASSVSPTAGSIGSCGRVRPPPSVTTARPTPGCRSPTRGPRDRAPPPPRRRRARDIDQGIQQGRPAHRGR